MVSVPNIVYYHIKYYVKNEKPTVTDSVFMRGFSFFRTVYQTGFRIASMSSAPNDERILFKARDGADSNPGQM